MLARQPAPGDHDIGHGWARDLDFLIQRRRNYFLFAGSQARPMSTRANPDRPPMYESAARPASTKETDI